MKSMKKLLALLLAGVMLVSMAACGGEDEDSKDEDEKVADTTTGTKAESNDGEQVAQSTASKTEDATDSGDDPVEGNGLAFEMRGSMDEPYYVVSIGTCTDTDIVIPATYKGIPVTEINASGFNNNTTITSVVIPESVKEIGVHAFTDCTSLESVTLSNGLEYISDYAFYGCKSLKTITIPESVTFVDSAAFYNCTSLESVVFSNPNGWDVDIDVADSALVAKYLSSYFEYSYHEWKRS